MTIDSDSVIERGALLSLAGPFRDPKIGAVAGRVEVYNRAHGIIPRMLHVRYMLSFDMLRAVESVYRNVYCCPGALTGLRAAGVRKVLERWKNQQFLGSRCTFGEDRAMTNYLLDSGYDTVYQRTAVVRTLVPISYVKLCKMLLRWDRSYVREEIRFTRIVWKRPWPTRIMAMFDRAVTNFRYPASYSSLGLLPHHRDAGSDHHDADGGDDRGDVAVQRALLPAHRALDELPVRCVVHVLLGHRALLDLPVRRRHGPLAQVDDPLSRSGDVVDVDSELSPQLLPALGQHLHGARLAAAPQPTGGTERAHQLDAERACEMMLPLGPIEALPRQTAA